MQQEAHVDPIEIYRRLKPDDYLNYLISQNIIVEVKANE
jgi:hypothetical protein